MAERFRLILRAAFLADEDESFPGWVAPCVGAIMGIIFPLIYWSPSAVSQPVWMLIWFCAWTGAGFLVWMWDTANTEDDDPSDDVA